ncbi:hypothetical protein NMY22_g14077 [Coprinellus aureogranulatus]|nr:hypothetical protein NMY22_g14077 [Coprinellus aureogranulatus]
MSRFFTVELDEAIREMERVVGVEEAQRQMREGCRAECAARAGAGEGNSNGGGEESQQMVPGAVDQDVGPLPAGEGQSTWSAVFRAKAIRRSDMPVYLRPRGTAGEAYVPPNLSESASLTPYYEIARYSDDELSPSSSHSSSSSSSWCTEGPPSNHSFPNADSGSGSDSDKFAQIWAFGEPVVVAGIERKFRVEWTPEYFMEEFGERECLITECELDSNKKTTVREFFGQFGRYGREGGVWKLKDWPPSADFKTAFPKLYKDFSDAVPVPDYVRRDGVCNIGSHFPTNAVAPDLGPKMYNAWAANQNPGCKGSTRLHMDMADAMNVMLFASPCPDGSPGCAVWDIYRAEDSDKIRAFLRKKHNLGPHYDPIHGQQYYLDDAMRGMLYKECAVTSYRVYQRPGEAVFVPAGCAHQVSNLADSIKIATDYVSPENVDRCAKLTKEFREQNKSKVWKEDILQLKTMMWFAWQSCSQQEMMMMRGAGGGGSNTRYGEDDTHNNHGGGYYDPPLRRRGGS